MSTGATEKSLHYSLYMYVVNTQCMHMRITVVCLSVGYQSTEDINLYNKMNIPPYFMMTSQGFQLWDFSKTLSFKSYSFRSF